MFWVVAIWVNWWQCEINLFIYLLQLARQILSSCPFLLFNIKHPVFMTFYFLTLGGVEVLVHWSLTTFPVALWQPAARATKSRGHLNKVSQQLSKRLSVIQNNHQACELWKNSNSPGGNIVKSCNTVKGRLCFFAWCAGLYSDPLNLSWILKTPHSKKLLSQDEEINLFCFFFFSFLS